MHTALATDRALKLSDLHFSTPTAETLVVFDSRVADLDLLYGALAPGSIGYTIPATSDALTTITELLARTGAKSLAIVAHGEPGVIHLGVQSIDLAVLATRKGLLPEWAVAEISLYCCEVGADAGFVAELARVTGARVAAAVGKVGAVELGGSWDLAGLDGSQPPVWLAADLAGYTGILGDEFLLPANTFTPGFQSTSSLATLSDGGFVMTWTSDGKDGSNSGVAARRFNIDGSPNGPEFLVNTFTTGIQANPSVAALSGGKFVVTWTSQNLNNGDIAGRLYNADGSPNGSEFIVAAISPSSLKSSVAALSGGGFVVTWTSRNLNGIGIGNGDGIAGRLYNADGTPNGNEFSAPINTFITGFQREPSVTALNGGGFVVTWTSNGKDVSGTSVGIAGRLFNADGTANGNEFSAPINTFTAGSQREPSVTALRGGGFVVTWTSEGNDGSSDGIAGRLFNETGTPQGNEFQVNTDNTDAQRYSAVTALSDGGFVVTWTSEGNKDGSGSSVFGQRYNATGTRIGSEFLVNNKFTDNDQFLSAVTALSGGGFAVAWTSRGKDGNGEGIAYRVFEGTPAVTAVNRAPAGTDKSISLNEDSSYVLTVADFGFTDPLDTPANALSAVKTSSLASTGSLKLNGIAVAAGDLVTVADLSAGKLTFTPATNAAGAANFTFQVQDNGGVANGGIDLDASANTINFNVAAVNDAPAGIDKSISLLGNSTYIITTTDFGFTDPNDTPANALSAVKISSLASTGSLKLNGIPVVAGDLVTAADISANKLTFTPATLVAGAANFTFQVQDNGGVANGGIDLDASVNTITFNVGAVNRPPAGMDKLISLNEDSTYLVTVADFGFIDVDIPPNALSAVKISSLASTGSLKLNGIAVTAGDLVTVADITANKLTFTPGNTSGSANFTFQVQDNGGTANGGIDLDPSPNQIAFIVTPVNDAPAGADKSISLLGNSTYTIKTTDFGFTDPNDIPPNALSAIKISSLASTGSLKLNGVAIAAGDLVTVADITANKLTFTPVANTTGSANFTFQVQDDGSVFNGGIDLDASANTITFNVAPVNQAPAGTDKSISLNEDSTHALTVADFGFTDLNDTPANALSAVKISSLASTGSLKLNGVAVAAGDLVTVADLSAGKLIFTPVANASGATNFTFQVQDNGGTANGGIDLDASANTITFNVAPVNDAPAGTDKSILLNEDSTYALTVADFGFTDPLDTPANALSAVKISSLASTGTLKLNGAAVAAGDLVTVADITGGKLTFTSVPNTSGAANFTFQVKDDGGIANGGVDLDPTANIITFNIAPINDAPAGTDKSISLVEDNTYALTAADFGFTDLNDTPANVLSAVKISSLVATGSLKLNGAAVTVGDLVAVADITAGKLTFSPVANANGNNYASFTFQVKDDGGVANGGIDLDATPNTITFNVTPANDAPVITIGVTDKATGSVTEIADGALGENARNLNVNGTLTITDIDLNDVQTVAVLPKGTPYAGTFTPVITDSTTGDGKGQITWSFSVPDKDLDSLAAGQVLTQTYTIIANDGQGGIANQDVTITLNGTNDAPTVIKPIKKETIGEGQALKFIIPADTFQDVDAGDKLTYSATLKDGKPLPTWLVLNPLTGEFSGTPTGTSAGEYNIKVIATDIAGATANTILSLKVLDFIGGKGNDTLHGTDYAETLAGGDGDDTLIGKAGDDCLEGGKGNDHLTGGDGHDKLYGGAGNDKLFGEADDDQLDGGEGDDHLEGGRGHDKLIGGKGNDKLDGSEGNDHLEAGAGDDTLIGGKGDDTLLGNAGHDYLEGSEGNDTYVFDISTAQGKDKIEEAVKGGYDEIVFEGDGKVKIDLSITTAQNINANLVLTVINLEDVMGSSGNDLISGNNSNNILAGCAGNDTLKGGKGDDAFVFGSSYLSFAAIGIDKIVDFAPTVDEIWLDKATFTSLGTLAGNNLLASDFEIVKKDSAVAASAAAIVYSSGSGKLFYNENGIADGLGLGGQFAELTKNLNLTSNDFTAIS